MLGTQLVLLAVCVSSTTLVDGVAVFGAHLVGAAAGDLIPAQMGATDDSLALLFHGAQLFWAAVGGLAALVTPQSPTAVE